MKLCLTSPQLARISHIEVSLEVMTYPPSFFKSLLRSRGRGGADLLSFRQGSTEKDNVASPPPIVRVGSVKLYFLFS